MRCRNPDPRHALHAVPGEQAAQRFHQAPLQFALAYVDGGAALMSVVFGQVTVNDSMVANFVAPQWQSRVFALRYCLSFGASATAIPLIAYVEPRHGFVGLYLILAVVGALTFLTAVVFPRTPPGAAVGQTT